MVLAGEEVLERTGLGKEVCRFYEKQLARVRSVLAVKCMYEYALLHELEATAGSPSHTWPVTSQLPTECAFSGVCIYVNRWGYLTVLLMLSHFVCVIHFPTTPARADRYAVREGISRHSSVARRAGGKISNTRAFIRWSKSQENTPPKFRTC